MRRTVKEARAPSPRLRITTPSKSCVRSFSPSTTLTCTRTVSPGPNPSRSFLSCPASIKRIASMTSSLSLWRPSRSLRSFAALESFHQRPVLGQMLADALVDALVAPREQDQVLLGRQLPGDALGERPAARVHQDHARRRGPERLDGREQRLRLEDHSPTAAERVVVGHAVLAIRIVSEIDYPDVN